MMARPRVGSAPCWSTKLSKRVRSGRGESRLREGEEHVMVKERFRVSISIVIRHRRELSHRIVIWVAWGVYVRMLLRDVGLLLSKSGECIWKRD